MKRCETEEEKRGKGWGVEGFVEKESILSLKNKRGKINEKEKKMRKKIVGFMIRGVLVFVLILTSTSVWAELSLAQVGDPIPSTGDMVLIPAGEFLMGSEDGDDDEKPVHKIYLDAYYIDKYEVTNAQFSRFLNEKGNQEESGATWLDIDDEECLIEYMNGRYQPKSGYDNHPVAEVSWYGARAYAKWAGRRLPTEAEWEKAARGGLLGKKYACGDSIDSSKANYGGNVGHTTPVGSYPPNGYGLYDMTGNVWEWVSDWYDQDYYSSSPHRNPQGPDSGSRRVSRGGCWRNAARLLRCAGRDYRPPGNAAAGLGFRCAKSP